MAKHRFTLVNYDQGFAAPVAFTSHPELFHQDIAGAIGGRKIEAFICKRLNRKTWCIRFFFDEPNESVMFGIKENVH